MVLVAKEALRPVAAHRLILPAVLLLLVVHLDLEVALANRAKRRILPAAAAALVLALMLFHHRRQRHLLTENRKQVPLLLRGTGRPL